VTTHQVKLATFASESGHWYDRNGNLVELIDGKKPDFRNKLVRTHDLAPGITSVMRMKSQPGLTRWLQQEAIRCALTLPRLPEEPEAAWLDRILDDSKETAKSAADTGTEIHKAIEQAYRGEPWDPAYDLHVSNVRKLLDSIAPGEVWLPEGSVISSLGVGSKIDLLGSAWGVDLKGTEKSVEELRIYDNHWMQCGFYDHVRPGRRWLIVYVHRVQAWAHAIEVKRPELAKGFVLVGHCLGMWQIEKNYRPSWAQETT